MAQTGAERAWRERYRGEPRGNKAIMDQFAALQARGPVGSGAFACASRRSQAPSGRLLEAYAALRRERDELAVLLAQIEAYQPGIAAKARAWVEQVDAAPQRRERSSAPLYNAL